MSVERLFKIVDKFFIAKHNIILLRINVCVNLFKIKFKKKRWEATAAFWIWNVDAENEDQHNYKKFFNKLRY